MDWNSRNTALDTLGRLGKAGGIPVAADPKLAIDELQRRTSTVAQAASQTLNEVFRGPRTGDNAPIFQADSRTTSGPGGTVSPTYNILTAAEATAEGFGAVSGLCIFRHGLGFVLDYYCVIRHALYNAAANPPNRMGNINLFAVDDNRTIFRLDADAISQQAVIVVTCWPSRAIPTNGISPTTTGASRGKNGYILAKNL